MEPPALKVRQVAALLQTTPDNVRALIHDGHIAAVKLDPDCDEIGRASEWRVPRAALDRWLGPWRPPSIASASSTQPAGTSKTRDGGLSREALRDRAGLEPEAGPSSTYPAADFVSDAPSGSVPPVHPEDSAPRPVVRLQGATRPEHPSERYLPPDDRARLAEERQREAALVRRSMDSPAPTPERHRAGGEASPIDGSTFGAGPAA